MMNGYPKPEEEMSPAEWLADSEVAVTEKTPDPLAVDDIDVDGQASKDVVTGDGDEGDAVRNASESERSRIWNAWLAKYGPTETSRRWLAIFAATDAPRTG
jgi:hypothetical protein